MSTSRRQRVFVCLLLLTLNLSTLTNIAFSQRRGPAQRQAAQKQAPQYGDKAESCNGWCVKVTYVQNVNQEAFKYKGEYDDGEANDSVYGGVTEKLSDGDHLI
jgi:hypothetical protein